MLTEVVPAVIPVGKANESITNLPLAVVGESTQRIYTICWKNEICQASGKKRPWKPHG